MDNYNNYPGTDNQYPEQPQYDQPQYDAYAQPQQYADPQYGQPQYNAYAQPQQYADPQYGQPQQYAPNGQPVYVNVAAPVGQLATNRGLLKFFLLSLITFGIYGIVAFSKASTDINIIASRYDGKKTAHFCLMSFVLAPITCGIYGIVWYHTLSARIGNELQRRGISYSFGAADFWLWNVLGAIILVGPFIYLHKFFKALNLLSENYNTYG